MGDAYLMRYIRLHSARKQSDRRLYQVEHECRREAERRALKAEAERDEMKAQALASEGQAAEAYAAQKRAETERDEAMGLLAHLCDRVELDGTWDKTKGGAYYQARVLVRARMDKERDDG